MTRRDFLSGVAAAAAGPAILRARQRPAQYPISFSTLGCPKWPWPRILEQASALGVGTVTRSTHCSAHQRPTFYSHRASRGADGRMVAYLGIPEAGAHERVSIDSRGKPQ